MIQTRSRLVLAVSAVLLAVGMGASAEAKPIAALTPNDLLAALPRVSEVRVGSQNGIWWPVLPEFYVGGNTGAGEMFYTVQSFVRVDSKAKESLESALTLYTGVDAARRAYKERLISDARNAIRLPGPSIGDECAYFANTRNIYRYGGGKSLVSTLRFRVGPAVGRISALSNSTHTSPDELVRYVRPVIDRIHQLVTGTTMAEAFPARIARCMPPESIATMIGPEFGSAVIPAEAWAAVDTLGDPLLVMKTFRESGVTQLGTRRYGLKTDENHVLDVTLFKFKDAAAAADWVRRFVDEAKTNGMLNAGRTGSLSAFEFNKDANLYELQFAKGPFVADVCGMAPFSDTQPICEAPVRRLAELWYESLPAH